MIKLFLTLFVINCVLLQVNGKCDQINELWSSNACPSTCDNLNHYCSQGQKGCYCVPGYVRDASNNCVEGNAYCGNCTEYEYYTKVGSPCQTECKTLGQTCNIVNVVAPVGCYCKIGYARDKSGECIPIERCPSKIIMFQ